MAMLVILSLFAAATNGLIIRDNYDVMTQDSFCGNTGDLFMDRGLIFRLEEEYLDSLPLKKGLDCTMSMRNLNGMGGIFLILQHLKLREDVKGCMDYIMIEGENSNNCKEIVMGRILLNNGTTWDPPKFISEFAGIFLTYPVRLEGALISYSTINIKLYTKSWPSLPGQRLSFVVSATLFLGDGIVNCPFGDCRDEGNCSNALKDLNEFINGNFTEYPVISNSTAAPPTSSRPFPQWLQKKEGGNGKQEVKDIHLQQDEWKENITQGLTDIKQEIKKNAGYLITILREMGVYSVS